MRRRQRSIGWPTGPLLALTLALGSAAHGEEPRAHVLFFDGLFQASGLSPDGKRVLGSVLVGPSLAAAVWRKGRVELLPGDPDFAPPETAHAASTRARVVLEQGDADRAVIWREGVRYELAAQGQARDVTHDGRTVVGFVGDPSAGTDLAVRWIDGRAFQVLAQEGFEARQARAISRDGRTLFGLGTFGGGALTRFLWHRGRAYEVAPLPGAIDGGLEPVLQDGIGSMRLSSDGRTATHTDLVRSFTICFRNLCRRDLDFQAWRWRDGRTEPLRAYQVGQTSVPKGITANGEVIVGSQSSLQGFGAFVWDPTQGMQDLAELLDKLGADVQGRRLAQASAISDDGRRIVGTTISPLGPRFGVGSFLATLPPACSDRLDNDGDGRVDYPEDLGCRDRNDRKE